MSSMLRMVIKGFVPLLVLLVFSQAQAAEYIVKYRNESSIMTLSGVKMQILDSHRAGQFVTVDIKDQDKISVLAKLVTNPAVEYVVPNAKVHALTVPVSDQALKEQWAIAKIQAEKAWQRAGNKGSRKVTVAVIDTGTDSKHKNLAPNMVKGFDFINNNENPDDITSSQNPGHGTHCAGIIGATGLVDGGTTGMAAEVSIMPLRFLDQNGSGDLNNGIKAIDYAIEKKVDVISASWGAAIPRNQAQPLIEAISRAEKAGIVFVVAASNDGQNNDSFEVYPANSGNANTISVAASNSSDGKPSWSNYGKAKVHLASPGDGIMSTLPKDKYGNLSGTSMATPLTAGLVAFIKAQDNSLNPLEIRSLLQASADKVSISTACDCRINASNAVDMVLDKKMFVSPFAITVEKGAKQKFEVVYGQGPFSFASANTSVATIDENGELTALSEGETTVTAKDSAGKTASSYKIYVGKQASNEPPDGEDPPSDGSCPLGDQALCDILCQIVPDLPFCQK
jgi:thermitase